MLSEMISQICLFAPNVKSMQVFNGHLENLYYEEVGLTLGLTSNLNINKYIYLFI